MSTAEGIKHENNEWVARRFAGDVAALSAAAERGDAKAQLAMVIMTRSRCDTSRQWAHLALAQWNDNVILTLAIDMVHGYLSHMHYPNGPKYEAMEDASLMEQPRILVNLGSATSQHIVGMFMYYSHCDSSAKADLLEAARWIRKAAQERVSFFPYFGVFPPYFFFLVLLKISL